MINKIIHYIWVGNSEKPDIVNKCINSWKKYMPDYEIIEWNESNLDMNECQFVSKAYESKKWAFVSDYFRFKILQKYGGIYLDTDVELIKPIPSEMLNHQAFTGVEYSLKVSPGLIYACSKNDFFAGYMVDYYQNSIFDVHKLVSVNQIITEKLKSEGFIENNQIQTIRELTIYPDDYFCGYDQDVKEICTTDRTISIHHYANTWNTITIKNKIQKIIKNMIGVSKYRKLLMVKRGLIKWFH